MCIMSAIFELLPVIYRSGDFPLSYQNAVLIRNIGQNECGEGSQKNFVDDSLYVMSMKPEAVFYLSTASRPPFDCSITRRGKRER